MAHGENARCNNGKDWWGKRPLSGYPVSKRSRVNKFFKRLLHKKERVQGEKQTNLDGE